MSPLGSRVRNAVRARTGPSALVLMYHRVASLERDPQLLSVSPANFDAHIEMLTERYRVISLRELVDALRGRSLADRSVVVTFDDGYADNLLAAEPVLAAGECPATVFVCSGYVESQREYWWDEIERIVLGPGELPAELRIEVGELRFDSSLADSRSYNAEEAARDAGWDVLQPPTNARQRVYLDLAAFLKPLSARERESALEQLAAAGQTTRDARPTHRPLTREEVHTLDASAVVDVGGHTSHHVALASRPVAEQREEILGDRDALTEMCGHQLSAFSYPYGTLADYTDGAVSIAREASFVGAVSNHPGVVKTGTDPFRIPRTIVRDWDPETFAAKIEGWFRGRF